MTGLQPLRITQIVSGGQTGPRVSKDPEIYAATLELLEKAILPEI